VTDTPLLRVDSLTVAFGARTTVGGVSFELAQGRCLGVIGESGAGKTQVFLGLMGLLPPGLQGERRDTSGNDALTLLVIAALFVVVSAAACYWPVSP